MTETRPLFGAFPAFALAAALSAAGFAASLCGCAGMPAKTAGSDFAPPKSVAILPPANESANPDAPDAVRYLFTQAVAEKNYNIQPQERTDEILRTKLSAEGGASLREIDPVKLAAALEVEAVIYGDVLSYKTQNLGVYQNQEVEVAFKMTDARTGRTLWENRKSAWNKELLTTVKSAAQAALAGVYHKLKHEDYPSDELTQKAVRWCAATLPRASGSDGIQVKSTTSSHHESETIEEEVIRK